jgi:hypothetical protein
MKKLKTILLAGVLTAGVFSTAVFTSCNSDACADVVCSNGGSCVDGTCACPTGFEGAKCETLSRDKFIGVFNGTEQCNQGSDAYAITISTNSDKTKFNIQNLYNNVPVLTAIASANGNAFTIPSQTVAAGVTAVGSGTINGNTITITYTVSGAVTNTCTFTGIK